ncbi:unnamed protein product [Bursaphelenchus xylophilus]|uniref:lysoplasmalogenase n=1 Tax=Bursaphelenchus xylophilus TaxID=6326 RepID=A0A1I7RW74_BURXY|nr:unnamed protein product [Bursaphelenchus xylophilus]CAG9095224.1 unnamed protein product [Bursaphelenchus xylophilus]
MSDDAGRIESLKSFVKKMRLPSVKELMDFKAPLIAFSSLIAYFYQSTDGFVQKDIIKYCTLKATPIWFLAAIAHYSDPKGKDSTRTRLALGLLFGGVGDFLLSTNDAGFELGIIAFGLCHIFYIAYFGSKLAEFSTPVTIFSLLYAFMVNHFLVIPKLWHDPLRMVLIIAYSFVISAAVIVAGSLFHHGSKDGRKGRGYMALIVGYCLFFVSDTVILLSELQYTFPHAHEFILFTYYAAQYLIFDNALTTENLA